MCCKNVEDGRVLKGVCVERERDMGLGGRRVVDTTTPTNF